MEYRVPDAAVNPYFSHTLLIASMEDGINRKLEPGAPDEASDNVPAVGTQLPLTLGDAVDAFVSDTYLTSQLPGDLCPSTPSSSKRNGPAYCGSITEWDREMYWETMP